MKTSCLWRVLCRHRRMSFGLSTILTQLWWSWSVCSTWLGSHCAMYSLWKTPTVHRHNLPPPTFSHSIWFGGLNVVEGWGDGPHAYAYKQNVKMYYSNTYNFRTKIVTINQSLNVITHSAWLTLHKKKHISFSLKMYATKQFDVLFGASWWENSACHLHLYTKFT